MFSAQLFGGQEEVFDFLEGRAERCRVSVQSLAELAKQCGRASASARARGNEEEGAGKSGSGLCGGFLSGVEREDIEALASALDGIARATEKIGEHFLAASHFLPGMELSRELAILKKATHLICSMIRELREGADIEGMMVHKEQLQKVEDEADKRVLEVLGSVYSGREDVFRALFLRELTGRFEEVVERCSEAGRLTARVLIRQA